jgi:predicted nuclease with TOPRIM domain
VEDREDFEDFCTSFIAPSVEWVSTIKGEIEHLRLQLSEERKRSKELLELAHKKESALSASVERVALLRAENLRIEEKRGELLDAVFALIDTNQGARRTVREIILGTA